MKDSVKDTENNYDADQIFEYLSTEAIDQVDCLQFDNCSIKMQKVVKVFNNNWIGRVNSVRLNCTEFGSHPKMSPLFCKTLCKFLEKTLIDSLELYKFKLWTSQFNMILKACRHLKNITIASIELIDKDKIRMAPLKFCFKKGGERYSEESKVKFHTNP